MLSRALFSLFALSSLKSVQTSFTPKFFDAFVSDWLKFLINIHDEIVALATNQAGRVRVKVSQVVKLFGALEATRKTPVRRTAKEKVAPQLQPKVRVVS